MQLIWELLCLDNNGIYVRMFGMVSVSPHPRGQVVSGYNPLKSFLPPLTVLVLSQKSKFLLSLLNIGLIRYSWSWNFLYVRPDIFECVSLILNKYWKALLLTFNFTIFLNPYINQKDVCFHFLYLSLWVRGEDKVHNIQIKVIRIISIMKWKYLSWDPL